MNKNLDRWKGMPTRLADTLGGRLARAERNAGQRRTNRAENFDRNRNLSPCLANQAKPVKSDPREKLIKWRAERELKKKVEQLKKKPIFKVGIVHHRYYSPTANDKIHTEHCHKRGAQKVKTKPSPPKRITRATQKRLDAKKAANLQTPVAASSASAVSSAKSGKKRRSSFKKLPSISFVSGNYEFSAPNCVTNLPLFGRYAIDRKSSKKSIQLAEEVLKEPWPTPQKMRNKLERQDAVSEMSSDLEDSFFEAIKEEATNATLVRDNVESMEENSSDDNVQDLKISEKKTPPRSGSPAPATFSPYVTMSRGKDNARRERRSKLGMDNRTPPDEIPTKETVMQNLNVSVEEEERTAQYFKFILQREMDRLEDLCIKWETVKSDSTLNEDAQYLINQAVGQTRLLIRKKFERFRGLVNDCETGKGEMLVQCRDLQGFWDMVYMEVKDCDSRFQKIETLSLNDWIENDVPAMGKTIVKNVVRKKMPVKKMQIKSSARLFIMERRKKMSEDSNEDGTTVNGSEPSTSGIIKASSESRRSPRRSSSSSSIKSVQSSLASPSPRKQTPAKKTPTSLLRKVQLSQASKNVLSPLTVMKISKMCKTPEVRLDDTISYVNSDQTPGKGILKKSEDTMNLDSSIARSSRKVDFHNDILVKDVPIDEETQNKIDLARALQRIDNYDSDESDASGDIFNDIPDSPKNVTIRRAEKRLDFEDESFNETENTDIGESAKVVAATPETLSLPAFQITLATPPPPSMKNRKNNHKRAKRRPSDINEHPDDDVNAQEVEIKEPKRILRSRKVAVTLKKGGNRISSEKKIDLDSSSKENYDPQLNRTNIDDLEISRIDDRPKEELEKRRRSSRKSVRFNAEDCTACADPGRPVHPMTPHTRKSRKVSLLGDNRRPSVVPVPDGDLMSFESPVAVPSRVRRASSSRKKSSER